MKKRMLKIAIMILAAVLFLLGGWYVLFMYFGIGPVFPFTDAIVIESEHSSGAVSEAEPLMALVDTREEAEAIAQQYGITFVSFRDGIATFYTDEDPEQVISRGRENGYAALYINYARELSDS